MPTAKPTGRISTEAITGLCSSIHTLYLDYHVDCMPGAAFGPLKETKLPGISTLAHMSRLQSLTIPRNALCIAPGPVEYVFQGSDIDPNCKIPEMLPRRTKDGDIIIDAHPEDNNMVSFGLPDSLRHVTLLSEHLDLDEEDALMDIDRRVNIPVETVMVLNCTKDREFRGVRRLGAESVEGLQNLLERKRRWRAEIDAGLETEQS